MRTIIALLMIVAAGLHAQTGTVITGRLLGYDGLPMLRTDIHAYPRQGSSPTGHAGKDGTFTVTSKDTGLMTVKFAGLFHMSEDITFLIEKPETLRVDIRLGTYRYIKPLGDLTLVTPLTTTEMKRRSDGKYVAEFKSKEKVSYEISGAEASWRRVNGTQSEDYAYDGEGDYRSIVTPKNGKATIVYDPALLLQSDEQPQLVFRDPESKTAKCAEALWAVNMVARKSAEYRKAFLDADSKNQNGLLARLAARLKSETDSRVLGLSYTGYLSLRGDETDSVTTLGFLKSAGRIMKYYPANRLYDLVTPFLSACRRLRYGEQCKAAFGELLDSLSDVNVKANVAMNVLSEIQVGTDPARAEDFYPIAVTKLAGHPWIGIIRDQYGPAGGLAVGQPLPAFAARSLSDTTTLTNQTFKGRFCLIDIWATWNSASLAELENLHRAYDRFKSPKFEILSLSLDASPEDVARLREKQWKMPWEHALITTNRNLLAGFPTLAFPNPVLIDTTGNVIALKDQLLGAGLEKTLSKVLGFSATDEHR